MKFLLSILNIGCLTATMFFMADTFYKNVDAAISSSLQGISQLLISNNSNMSDGNMADGNITDMASPSMLLQPPPLTHYAVIKKRNLFKTITEAGEKKEEKKDLLSKTEIESLEKTDLNLKLWGTVKGWDAEDYAVIESGKNKKQGLYKQGDEIEGTGTGAVIKRVLRLSVVLHHNGKDQILEMSDEPVNGSRHTSYSTSSRKSEAASSAAGSMEMTIQRSMINESMNDINNLMKQVRIRPHFTAGQADGILLYGIKQNSMFKKMGIQNGDIIMGVDGTDIRSVEDAITLYDTLKNASEVKMQIKRRGKTKELLYHVE